MALSRDRNTPMRNGDAIGYPLKAGVILYAGALTVLDAGYAAPGREASGLVAVGRSEQQYDNRHGQDGGLTATIRTGVFQYANDSAAPLDRTHIGSRCFVVDDAAVSASDNGGARSAAGRVVDIDSSGVWVQMGPAIS